MQKEEAEKMKYWLLITDAYAFENKSDAEETKKLISKEVDVYMEVVEVE